MTEAKQAIYEARADLYDRIYSWKDYRAEAARVRGILHDAGVRDGARLLDAACGTGAHLAELEPFFSVAGFDKNPAMLEIARQKLPNVELWEADLRDFSVARPFDAVVCLFSAIGYVHEEAGLRAAAGAFARALAPDGVLVLEPWLAPEDCLPGSPSMHTYSDDNLKLCRQAVTEVVGDMSAFDMHWLVARRDRAIEHFVERHELRLYTREQTRLALELAGLDVRFEPQGLLPKRGLWIGRRGER